MGEGTFSKAKWIWVHGENRPDEYAEFVFNFAAEKAQSGYTLAVTADSNYNVYLNGELVGFGQPADYPHYKIYDVIDLKKVRRGENEVKVLVWYYGVEDTQTYMKDDAGAIFELCKGKEVVYYSSEETLGRICASYENYRNKLLTTQLGLGYKYDATAANDAPYSKSVCRDKGRNFHRRATENLELRDRVPIDIVKTKSGWLIDMREETVGFLDLEFTCDREAALTVAYGEYLTEDGGVLRYMGADDFSVEYVAKKGKNVYTNYFRRLAGRFLQIFTDAELNIDYVGLRPVMYPLTPKPVHFRSELRNRIYDTCVKTLLSCMHEHYEDCPWREQALYNMDGRNEMLCSYDAFGDYKFARANLVLMSKGLRKDGLLSICFPSADKLPIPSFSAIYPVEVYEYIERSGDTAILNEVFGAVDAIMNAFIARIDPKVHLIADFPYPCWNFYEWSDRSDNCNQITRGPEEENPLVYRLSLNCEFVFALGYYRKLCKLAGKKFDFDESAVIKAIKDTFYDAERGLYREQDSGTPYYTVLGNSYAVLCGLGDETVAEKLTAPVDMVPITLSMCIFLYEALLKTDKRYKKFVLEDLDRKYHRMLCEGATTFWETEKGKENCGHTGSLCHGWSALPIRYYLMLNGKEYYDGTL